MNEQQTQQQTEWTNATLDRLVENYLSNAEVPWKDGANLSPAVFHKMLRAILAEGYGR